MVDNSSSCESVGSVDVKSDVDTGSVSVELAVVTSVTVAVCVAISHSVISSSLCTVSSPMGGAVGVRGSGMFLFSSNLKDFLAVLFLVVCGARPAVYRPGIFSGGGATTPCAFAIGMFISDTVWALAIVAVLAVATFALNFIVTCFVLSLALENIALNVCTHV